MEPSKLIGFFKGTWALERKVISSQESENIHAEGFSEFVSTAPNFLEYKESLEVKVNARLLESHRSYFYEYCSESTRCYKLFEDKSLFYELIFKEEKILGHHKCLEDTYEAHYKIKSDTSFALEYKVFGPMKNYTIVTNYARFE
jgi:hypothetical protein